jgi:hypothetical protein
MLAAPLATLICLNGRPAESAVLGSPNTGITSGAQLNLSARTFPLHILVAAWNCGEFGSMPDGCWLMTPPHGGNRGPGKFA